MNCKTADSSSLICSESVASELNSLQSMPDKQALQDSAQQTLFTLHKKQRSTLPAELITAILQRMDCKTQILAAMMVNKAWASAGLSLLWKRTQCSADEWDSLRLLFQRPKRLYQDYRHDIRLLNIYCPIQPWTGGDLRLSSLRTTVAGCISLTSLHIHIPSFNDDDCWILSKACPQLTSISFVSGVQPAGCITDEGLVALAQNCKQLKHICIKSMLDSVFSERGISALAQYTKGRLTTFGLELCSGSMGLDAMRPTISADSSRSSHRSLSGSLPLSRSSSPVVSDVSVDATGSALHFISIHTPTINRVPVSTSIPLSMSSSSSASSLSSRSSSPIASQSNNGITLSSMYDSEARHKRFGDALRQLVVSSPDIHTLRLDWPVAMDEMLAQAAQSLRHLKCLTIGNSRDFSSIALLIRANPYLKSLALIDVTFPEGALPVILQPLVSHHFGLPSHGDMLSQLTSSPQITHQIDVDDNMYNYTQNRLYNHGNSSYNSAHSTTTTEFSALGLISLVLDGIGFLTELVSIASQFHSLTTLKLAPSRRTASIADATTAHIHDLAIACPNLTTLHIPISTDHHLVTFAQSCPNLVDVDMMDGNGVSNQALVVLVKMCSGLMRLRVGAGRDVTDLGLEMVAKVCNTRLTHLAFPFSGGIRIGVKSVEAVAMYCSGLKSLDHVPVGVGVDVLVSLLPKLTRLRSLGINVSGRGNRGGEPGGNPIHTGLRLPLSKMDQDRIKQACKNLKQITCHG
ncbi:hypothetical protein MT418_003749 [Batrachochytrium dendrobatidis]